MSRCICICYQVLVLISRNFYYFYWIYFDSSSNVWFQWTLKVSPSMDYHFKEYFHEFSEDSPTGNFHKVIALHETPGLSWNVISAKVPQLSRAWWELAQLKKEERIELLHEFWETKMEYHQNLGEFLANFFSGLDDIGIYLTQKKFDDPYEVQLVYSLPDGCGYYRGAPPATDEDIAALQNKFSNIILPADYLAFLGVHNGFFKTTDSTGLTKSGELYESYKAFQLNFAPGEVIYTNNGQIVDCKKLIPFYKSFGMPYYQCFWAEWYPENEMGVVYYSSDTRQVSDVSDGGTTVEHLCFSTFTDWLIFYLERIDT